MSEDEVKSSPTPTAIKHSATEWPAWPPPPRARPRQGPSKQTKIITIALAALLIVGGLGFVIFAAIGQYGQALGMQRSLNLNATVRSQVNQWATVVNSMASTAQPLATANGQIFATATAQDQSTATADDQATATASEMSDFLTKSTAGTPALNDPLIDNSLKNQWSVGYSNNNGTGCNFINDDYEDQEALQGFLNPCFAEATHFHNFVYQVSMTISAGQEGGIIFCADKDAGTYYLFRVDITGSYALDLYQGTNKYTMLTSGIDPAITTGIGQSNALTVIVNKGVIYLFVNQIFVSVVTNKTLNAGQIGVAAINSGLPGAVDFSDAQVWTL